MMPGINQIRHAGIVLTVSLILAAVAGALFYKHQKDALINEAFSRLALYHDLRKATLQDYMRSKASDVAAMSRNERVLKGLHQLEKGKFLGIDAPFSSCFYDTINKQGKFSITVVDCLE